MIDWRAAEWPAPEFWTVDRETRTVATNYALKARATAMGLLRAQLSDELRDEGAGVVRKLESALRAIGEHPAGRCGVCSAPLAACDDLERDSCPGAYIRKELGKPC